LCRAAGCDHFLTKPIVRERFYSVLSGHLRPAAAQETPQHGAISRTSAEFKSIAARFIRALPERIAQMQVMAEQLQWEQLGAIAHQLKGSAGGLGFPQLGRFAAEIEAAIRGNRCGEVPILMHRLAACARQLINQSDAIKELQR
jgi:HPt (histidine-containing phosphotransfer) domain-containing protein